METTLGKPRHNLVLQPKVHAKLMEMAERQDTTITEIIKTCLKIGLLALEVEQTPGAELIIREDGVERKLLIV